jgi:hypothetical protein
MNFKSVLIALIVLQCSSAVGQTRTMGLFLNDTARVYKGYTLFAPKQNTMTYLINNEGRIVHQWTASKYPPGQSVYLLENGNILRTCMTKGQLSTGGGEGGRVEEYNWNDSLVWSLDYSTTTYMQHHDIRRLPNGNIIMLVIEKKTYAEVIAAGFNPSKFQTEIAQKGMMVPDYVVEIQPTRPSGGTVVWEWHVWDHLIQDYDAAKLNFGDVRSHPELIDCAGDQRALPAFWNHMNSIDYNASLDQIVLSVRGNSEFWIIDHSTTTAEAKGHTGGKRGKGGDLLYRWGNSTAYRTGTASDQKLYQQHDAEWIKSDCPGAGDIMVFNNGIGRNYSTVDEMTPVVDAGGNYTRVSGSAYGPTSLTWTYQATPPTSLYAEDISGAQRLTNGNTLINDGPHGTFMEVTSAGLTVWKYINPVDLTGPLTQGGGIPDDASHPGEKMNSVFRVYKYPLAYAAFVGKTLTPGDFVEKYATAVRQTVGQVPSSFELFQNYPNPFNPSTLVRYQLSAISHVTLRVVDLLGRDVETLVDQQMESGVQIAYWDASRLPAGVYFIRLSAGTFSQVKRAVLLK